MQLKNKAQRERFLENYRTWGLMLEIPELELKFYKYTFPNGTAIIATEHAAMRFARYTKTCAEYRKSVAVKYHLILDESDTYKVQFSEFEHRVYNPTGDSKTSIVEYLTKTKPEIDCGGELCV